MSNFTFFHNVFHAICTLKSFNSHISVVVCSFFEFGAVYKLCIRKWVNHSEMAVILTQISAMYAKSATTIYLSCRCPEYENTPDNCRFVPDPRDPSCCVMPECPSSTTPSNSLIPTPAPSGVYVGPGQGTGKLIFLVLIGSFLFIAQVI